MKKMIAAIGAAFLLVAFLGFAPIFRVGASPVYTSLYRAAITGSLIDSTAIGSTTPSTGSFTTLSSTSGALNGTIGATSPNNGYFYGITATSGTLNGVVIGNSTPSSGNFTTVAASSGFTGTLTGNVSTATALQSTPTNCGSTGRAYGIAANGNALCLPSTMADQWVTFNGCAFANDGAGIQCNTSATFPSPFADSSYYLTCSWYSGLAQTNAGAVPSIAINPVITSSSGFTFYEETQTGSSTGWPISNSYSVSVTCHGHHN